jgi:hypothetical protein
VISVITSKDNGIAVPELSTINACELLLIAYIEFLTNVLGISSTTKIC